MSHTPIASVQDYFDGLPKRFVPQACAGLHAVFQFEFDVGTWHVAVDDGSMSVHRGPHPSPTSTVSTREKHWVRIVNGDLSGLRAVMTRRMKVGGDVAAAQKLAAIFPAG